MDDQEKTLTYLVAVEKLAEEILSDKQEIILIDKRRNENREALRELRKSKPKNCLVTIGTNLVKCPLTRTVDLLEKDQKQLDVEINKLRSELKVKVNSFRDLEHQPPVPGLMLTPLSNEDTRSLKAGGLYG